MSLFDEIQGHDRIKTFFRHAVEKNRLYGSYLFTGPEGIGKKKTALAIAALLNCDRRAHAPCGDCAHCRKIMTGNHVDVLTVSAEKNEIKGEQVEPILDSLRFAPFEGRHRVIIFDNAHQFNPTSGNMILKTLEEPPDHTHFFLITNRPDILLPTIRSRCQEVAFSSLSPQDIPVPEGLDPALVHVWFRTGGGFITDAKAVQSATAERELALTVLESFLSRTPAYRIQDRLAEVLPANERERTLRFFFFLTSLLRDILVFHAGKPDAVLNRDALDRIRTVADRITPDVALDILRVVNQARNRVFYNISIHQLITVMVTEGRRQVP